MAVGKKTHMPMSPEGGPSVPDNEKGEPAIRVNMDMATPDDYKRLKDLGWIPGNVSANGEFTFGCEGKGDPILPDDLAEKVLGTAKGKIEYSFPTKKG